MGYEKIIDDGSVWAKRKEIEVSSGLWKIHNLWGWKDNYGTHGHRVTLSGSSLVDIYNRDVSGLTPIFLGTNILNITTH